MNINTVNNVDELQCEIDDILKNNPISNFQKLAESVKTAEVTKTISNKKVDLTFKIKIQKKIFKIKIQKKIPEILNAVVAFHKGGDYIKIEIEPDNCDIAKNKVVFCNHSKAILKNEEGTIEGKIGRDLSICKGKKYDKNGYLIFDGAFLNNENSKGKKYKNNEFIYRGTHNDKGERHGIAELIIKNKQITVKYQDGFLVHSRHSANPLHIPENTKIKVNEVDSNGLMGVIVICSKHDQYQNGFETTFRIDEQGNIKGDATVKISDDLTFTGTIGEDYTPRHGIITDKAGNKTSHGICRSFYDLSLFIGPLDEENQPHGVGMHIKGDVIESVELKHGKEVNLDIDSKIDCLREQDYQNKIKIPTDYRCPIDQELLEIKKIVVLNGHYFDKDNLFKALEIRSADPLTNLPVQLDDVCDPGNDEFIQGYIAWALKTYESKDFKIFELLPAETKTRSAIFNASIIHAL